MIESQFEKRQLWDLATFQRYKNTNFTVITPFLPPHLTHFIFNFRMDIFRYNDTWSTPPPPQPNQPKLFYGTDYSKLNNKVSHFPIYCLCFRNWKLLTCTETPLNLSNVSHFFLNLWIKNKNDPLPHINWQNKLYHKQTTRPRPPPPHPHPTSPRKKTNNSNTFNESTSKNRITKSFI